MSSDEVALYHRAVLDGDLYAQHDLARLDEEQREAEYARIFWAEEERPASTRSGLGGDTCRASTTCVQSAGSATSRR